MVIGHVTKTGNISIPKKWRDELGISPNSSVLIEKEDDKIIIEPLKKNLLQAAKKLQKVMDKKGVYITREEAIKDDLYD